MKTAIIYYSLDGNCTFVAEEIKNQLNADIIQLHVKSEKKRIGIFKFFWCCNLMFSHNSPPLKPYTFDPSKYDLIILGAPVWASSPASPIKTFITNTNITGKKIALYVCHAGGKGDSLEKLKALLPKNEIISEADFINPAKTKDKAKDQIANWAKSISSTSS